MNTKKTNLSKVIYKTDIRVLIISPVAIGLIFVIFSILLYKYVTHQDMPVTLRNIVLIISCFFSSLSGVFQIIRKETIVPYFLNNNKIQAIVNGIMVILFYFIIVFLVVMFA
jgi:hypothetical protein